MSARNDRRKARADRTGISGPHTVGNNRPRPIAAPARPPAPPALGFGPQTDAQSGCTLTGSESRLAGQVFEPLAVDPALFAVCHRACLHRGALIALHLAIDDAGPFLVEHIDDIAVVQLLYRVSSRQGRRTAGRTSRTDKPDGQAGRSMPYTVRRSNAQADGVGRALTGRRARLDGEHLRKYGRRSRETAVTNLAWPARLSEQAQSHAVGQQTH